MFVYNYKILLILFLHIPWIYFHITIKLYCEWCDDFNDVIDVANDCGIWAKLAKPGVPIKLVWLLMVW